MSNTLSGFRSRSAMGFTLLELMITLLIISILSMMALPALGSWVDSVRAKTVQQQLYSMTSEARSIALKQAQTMTLCRLETDICDSDFGFPISVFTDVNRNAVLDSGENVVRFLDFELPEKVSLSWNRSGYLRFWPSGGTGALTGSLSYCDQVNADNDFRLVIARTGRVRVDRSETRCP